MKKFYISALCATTLALGFSACSKDNDNSNKNEDSSLASNEVLISADITSNRTFVSDSVYVLRGQINVNNGVSLNINAGTIIKGDKASKASLIILPGAKIMAEGTKEKPIVFTSREDKGYRSAGDWGGLVICGNAQVNQDNAQVEGLSRPVNYGRRENPINDENSGILKYVRIEYAGIALQTDMEINGLTLCAVGAGTTIEYVQVAFCGDDSFEWFGGTVNCKYLVSYHSIDDDFDTDNGYSGKVQFALAVRHPSYDDVSTSNGFESDNDKNGTEVYPKTSPIFSNVSLIGAYKTADQANVSGKFGAGLHLRRNTSLSIFNSVVAGWNTGLLLDGTTTESNVTNGNLVFANLAIVGTKDTPLKGANGVERTAVEAFFNNAGFNNLLIASNAEAGISGAFYGENNNFLPEANSPLLGAAAFTNEKLNDNFFDKTANFMGAFGNEDWTAGWCNFDPQNTDY
ncbi:MAG: hypothetical protein ACRCY6_05400 [Bacteroidales bacterium]